MYFVPYFMPNPNGNVTFNHQISPYDYWYPTVQNDYRTPTLRLRDYGPNPFTINIKNAARRNRNYRTALWTGNHLQVTLMSLNPGEDIGLEIHPDVDQFLRIEQGKGIVRMGKRKDRLDFERRVNENTAIFVPAGTWHNVINTGNVPLKLYSIYAPPHHPHGTVHRTKQEAMAEERIQYWY